MRVSILTTPIGAIGRKAGNSSTRSRRLLRARGESDGKYAYTVGTRKTDKVSRGRRRGSGSISWRTGALLWAAARAWRQALRAALAPLDLTPTQFLVLEATARLMRRDRRREGPSQQMLARDLKMDKMTISQVIRGLERRGLVDRDIGDAAPLAWAVMVLSEGEALLARALPEVQKATQASLAPLTRGKTLAIGRRKH